MKFSARQIAELLDGEIEGDPDATVSTLSKIEEGEEGSLSFLANPQYTPFIYDTQASIVIVNKSFVAEKSVSSTLIRVEDAYASFAKLLEMYDQIKRNKQGIDKSCVISESAKLGKDLYLGAGTFIGENTTIGDNVKIYPNCYVGDNVEIGEGSVLHPGVKVYAECKLGKEVNIHAGAVIGADGFGFAPSNSGYSKVAQIGNVILEDKVEIGANTTIDRATLGSTIIRKGVKLDNLIQVAHNVEIGEHTVIAAQTGVAGSTKIGKNCMIGGQVGIIGHLKIGDNVRIAAQSGIGSDVPDNKTIQGSPAFDIGDYKRSYVYFRKLPDLASDITELKKNIQSKNDEK